MTGPKYVQLEINPALADAQANYNAAMERYYNAVDNIQAFNYRSGEVIYEAQVNMAQAEATLNGTPLIVPKG